MLCVNTNRIFINGQDGVQILSTTNMTQPYSSVVSIAIKNGFNKSRYFCLSCTSRYIYNGSTTDIISAVMNASIDRSYPTSCVADELGDVAQYTNYTAYCGELYFAMSSRNQSVRKDESLNDVSQNLFPLCETTVEGITQLLSSGVTLTPSLAQVSSLVILW